MPMEEVQSCTSDANCGYTKLICPDEYEAACQEACDLTTGYCTSCAPDCTGHEAECEVDTDCAQKLCDPGTTCPEVACIDGRCVELGTVQPDEYKCTDSDGGREHYIKGHTVGVNDEGTDFCGIRTVPEFSEPIIVDSCEKMEWESGKSCKLYEWVCGGSEFPQFEENHAVRWEYECPYGCKDGACVTSDFCVGKPNCVPILENDCGINPTDACLQELQRLYDEAYALAKLSTAYSEWDAWFNIMNNCRKESDMKKCAQEYGYIPIDVACSESDGGEYYYIYGETCVGGNCKNDFCLEDARMLKEYYCQSTNDIDSINYYCPNECVGGACVQTFEPSKYQYAEWECYDGHGESQEDPSCKEAELWILIADSSCEGHCNEVTDECGRKTFSFEGECPMERTCRIISYEERQEMKKECEMSGERVEYGIDNQGCDYLYCTFGEVGIIITPGPAPKCPPPEALDGWARECEEASMEPVYVESGGCAYVECVEEMKCPYSDKDLEEERYVCESEGGKIIKTEDTHGCALFDCVFEKCPRAPPQKAQEECAKEGGKLRVKYDENGCTVAGECIKRGDSKKVKYPEIKELPEATKLLDAAFKLESLKIEFDEMARKSDKIADYYASVGDEANEQKFRIVAGMFETAEDEVDRIKEKLRANLDTMAKGDLIEIKHDIRYLKEVIIKDIVYLMLSSGEELTSDDVKECGEDDDCFENALRICQKATYEVDKGDEKAKFEIFGLEDKRCIIEGIIVTGGAEYDLKCKFPNYGLGDIEPSLEWCSGSWMDMVDTVVGQTTTPPPPPKAPVKIEPTCTETDDGRDYYEKGKVYKGGEWGEDFCEDSKHVVEFECTEEGEIPSGFSYECPTECVDGACIYPCTDTDGGRNYYEKGTACEGEKCDTDFCQDSKHLMEIDCGEAGGSPFQDGCGHSGLGGCSYECPEGCEDGACIKESEVIEAVYECSDSDGGIDYYEKGEMCWGGVCKTDFCSEAETMNLEEYYCQAPDDPGSIGYLCPNGCIDGACVGATTTVEAVEATPVEYSRSKWECYDEYMESHEDASCRSSEQWNEQAEASCEGHCSEVSGKCGVNYFSVAGECI